MVVGEDETLEFVDTSVLARYLVGDTPALASRAINLIDSDRRLRVSHVVVAELGFVLTRRYGISRTEAADAMVALLNRENIDAHEVPTDLAVDALSLCSPAAA